MKLPNTVTIDSIYEKNFLSLSSVLEAVVVDAFVLPGRFTVRACVDDPNLYQCLCYCFHC